MKGVVRPFSRAPTVAGVWLVDFPYLYASIGRNIAIGAAFGVTNVLNVLVDAPFLLTTFT